MWNLCETHMKRALNMWFWNIYGVNVWNPGVSHISHVILTCDLHMWFACDLTCGLQVVKKTKSASALFPYLDKYIVWLQKTWNTVHRSYRQPFWHFYSVLLAYLELGSKNQHQFLLLEKEQLSLTPHFVLHRRRKIIWGREWHERKLWCSFS